LQNRNLMAALAGGFPSDRMSARFLLGEQRLPRDLPLSLPAKLIEQRPDVRMAEENLHAASAQIGVAITNRLPNITLTANAGSTSDAINTMFGSGTQFWGVTAAATQPVFHGGTLFHRELAAKDTFDEALAQYRGTVITAFQNVADSLRAIQTDAVALQKAVASERAAHHSLDIVRGRLKLGDDNYLGLLNAEQTYQQAVLALGLLNAEQTYQQAVLALAQARAARYADTVALFQALGGGWWNRQDVEPDRPTTFEDFFQ
jgi:NodT family efflux transporter outer membrane factor (OMF) lipoprotein